MRPSKSPPPALSCALVAAVSLAVPCGTRAQAPDGHPPAKSSVSAAATAPAAPQASPGVASGSMPTATHHSDIHYADGLLTVSANNAGLNGLIREIASRTGMRVTGSVADDRVFGTYGPADPARVLAMLLDGTGTNLVFVQDAADLPRELILTARTGGVTPPDPNAAARNDAEDTSGDDGAPPAQPMRRGAPPRSMLPTNAPGYAPAPASPQPSPQQQVGGQDQNPSAATGAPSSTEQPVVFPRVDANTPPSTASSSPADNTDSVPQDTKTPQQIFEELQKLRQQQQPTPAAPQ